MLFSPSGKKSHIFARVGLTLALVINLTLPAFASDLTSGSAFGVDERLLAAPRLAAAAAAPVGSSTDPFYVKPFTNGNASMYRYTWSSTNPNGITSGINVSFTNFADIVTHITNSIAQSVFSLAQRLHYDNDAIYGRLYDILQALQTGISSPEFWVSSVSQNGVLPPADSSFWSDSSSKGLKRVTAWYLLSGNGEQFQEVFDDLPLFQQLKYILITTNTSMVRGLSRLTYHTSGDYSLYSMDDMSSIDIPDSFSSGSLWDTTIRGFSNLSYGLSKLAYVLANDDDIALRQSQHDNMQAVKDDFTIGDVSVSPAKLGGLKSVGSALTDGFSSSASVSDGLSVLGSDSDAWSWFSEENAQAFDSSRSRNMRMLKSGTGYLDQYYKDVLPYVN